MNVRVLKPFMHSKKVVHEGEVIEVDERRAATLISKGLAVPSSAAVTSDLQSISVEGADTGTAGPTTGQEPTDRHPSGSQTGEDHHASSSRRGRRRSTHESSEHEAEHGSSA